MAAANGFVTISPDTRFGDVVGSFPSSYIFAAKFLAPGSGSLEINEIGIWCEIAAGYYCKMAIFAHDVVNNCPESMIPDSETDAVEGKGSIDKLYFQYSAKPIISGGSYYWMAYTGELNNSKPSRFENGSGIAIYKSGQSYGVWPTGVQWETHTDQTHDYSFYAVYTAGGTAYTLDADPGAFTLSGQLSSLLAGRKLPAEAGPFSLSGQGAAFLRGRVLAADAGALTLSGQQALLLRGLRLLADPGAFALTGQPAAILRGYRLMTEAGTFALSGQAATLLRSYLLEVEPGVFVLSGQAARLLYSGEELTTITILLDLSPVTEIVMPQPVTEAALEGTPVTEIRL